MAQAKRKKRFFDVGIPLIGRETNLLAYELEELEGKTIRYDMTRMLKGKNVILTLVVKKEGSKMVAVPKKIEMIHSTLARMVRRGTDYIEDSFSAECKNARIKIKPFLISRRKIHNSVKRSLRNKAKEELVNYVKDKTANELFEELTRNQLQKPLSLKLKKIYPLSAFEIRILEIEKPLENSAVEKPKAKKEVEEKVKPEKQTESEKPSKEVKKE